MNKKEEETILRNLRIDNRLYMKDVAGSVGITVSMLSRIERGLTPPTAILARKLLRYYQGIGKAEGLTELDFLYPGDAGNASQGK